MSASGIWTHSIDGLMPFADNTALLASNITTCVATVATKVTSGITRTAMLAFETTAVRSETGIDFQNKMLRSRRSPYRASRQ